MELSHQDFKAIWQRHFKQPVHPFAAALLAATKGTIWLKEYDDEYVAWCFSGGSGGIVSFNIGFFLPRDADEWQVQLPSAFHVFDSSFPKTQAWIYDAHPPGSNRTSEYAKWTQHPYFALFCSLEVILDADGVRLATFFGGEPCE